MEYVIIALTVLVGSGLTFFSGFGLGTLMLPVFSLFFDLSVAVGATAVVHLMNNLFKFALVSRHIDKTTLVVFGIPALIAAALGAWTLTLLGDKEAIHSYLLAGREFSITLIGIVIGSLMIFFAWVDLDPRFKKWQLTKKHLPYGGFLSGFFGGLSGHQGAFRATFLTKAGLTKEEFIGTSNAVSLIVDLVRISSYFLFAANLVTGENKFSAAFSEGKYLLMVGIVFAFAGTYFGRKLVKKTTISGIQRLVGVLLFVIGALMIFGII